METMVPNKQGGVRNKGDESLEHVKSAWGSAWHTSNAEAAFSYREQSGGLRNIQNRPMSPRKEAEGLWFHLCSPLQPLNPHTLETRS